MLQLLTKVINIVISGQQENDYVNVTSIIQPKAE